MTVDAMKNIAGGDGESRLGHALLWAAALVLAFLHMMLFTRGYRMSADDAGFIETFMSGYAAICEAGSIEAHTNGRIGMFLLRPLNTVAAYLSGYYPARLGFVALYYLNFMLFSTFVSRVLRTNVTLLLFVILVVMHPLAFEHMPPNAYPLQNTLPFLLILASRIMLMRLRGSVGKWRIPGMAAALLLFVSGMFFSEYAIVFGTALLLTEYSIRLLQQHPALGLRSGAMHVLRQKSFLLDSLAVAAVVGAYLIFRWFNPSHYDGNSADGIFNVARIGMTAIGHIAWGTIFGQIEPRLPSLGGLAIANSLLVGMLAAACVYFLAPRARGHHQARALLAVSAAMTVYVALPLAVTLKQQTWCVDSGACGFLDSRVSYLWVGVAVLCVLSLLLAKPGTGRHAKFLLVAISLAFGVVSTITYASNWRQAERMEAISKAWEKAGILACLPHRIPRSDEALKGLVDPRSEVMFHPTIWQQSYWRRYVTWMSAHAACPTDQQALWNSYVELVEGVHPIEIGKKLKFSRTSDHVYLGMGWSPESWGVWSVGNRATVKVGFAKVEKDMILTLHALRHDVGANTQPVTIEFNGKSVAALRMTNAAKEYAVHIPASVTRLSDGVGVINFVITDPISPRQAGSGVDTRQLGVGLVDMTLTVAN